MERNASAAGAPDDRHLMAAQARAATDWRRLGMRVRGITPGGLARFLMVAGAVTALLWLATVSWPALLPFIVGAAIAYLVLPIVNALDRVMPRLVAATLTTTAVLLVAALVVVILVRPVVLELIQIQSAAQDTTSTQALTREFERYLGGLPQPLQSIVQSGLQQTIANVQERVREGLSRVQNLDLASALGVLRSVGAVLGLLVLPIWLLLVLKDQRKAGVAIHTHLPQWIAADFWAVVRILDRAFGVHMRGLALQGIVTGIFTFAGLSLLHRLGLPQFPFPLALAVLAGLLKLIPTFGPILNGVVAVLVGLTFSPRAALAALALYLVVNLLVNRLVADRVRTKVIDINPAILAAVLVALSQFGLLWALLAAPIAAVVVDLYRYTYGRLGDPPRPAGLLPGQPLASPARRRRSAPVRATAAPTRARNGPSAVA